MALWSLRERTTGKQGVFFAIEGALLLLFVWQGAVELFSLPKSILPSPRDVVVAFPMLLRGTNVPTTLLQRACCVETHNSVVWHIGMSLVLNLAAYLTAIGIAVPLGFAIGLFGPIRAATERELSVFRYAPITAFVGIFIRWFGISWMVKITFLAFGLLVYLVPAVVQRIDEVDPVLTDTAKTCGASRLQRIRTVFWPLVSARLSDDCRTLVPITWTYLIIAEGFNLSEGGLGALVNGYTRSGRWDLVFALVAMILIIGFCQDKIWTAADRIIFNWKYV